MTRARRALRVVIDTNLFVSGLILRRGRPFDLLEAWRAGIFVLLMSAEQRIELHDVLHRPAILDKYSVSDSDIVSLFRLLDLTVPEAPTRKRLSVKVRDPKDEAILAGAIGGKADYLITGDNDLLALQGEEGLGTLRIVTVADFLDTLDRT